MRLHGHLGDRVSALVDGQLSAQEEEQAWSHTMSCAACRRLVEREGWMKSRLAGMSAAPAAGPQPRPGLLGALYDVDAWAVVDEIEREDRTRRVGLTAVGVGSVGAAVLGIVALTGAPAGSGQLAPSRPAPAQISYQMGSQAAATGQAQNQAQNQAQPGAGLGASTGPVVAVTRHRAR
ncbi:anti-sigma factor [Nocardioides mangrovicus]|uniref:hypothetical protein n=1 Tax=Nocardioides mangrovicus TaxID=2478913 RepID=UPI0013140644|nr:hypothetical protein [Nocardioides mangrovicus]